VTREERRDALLDLVVELDRLLFPKNDEEWYQYWRETFDAKCDDLSGIAFSKLKIYLEKREKRGM